MPVPDPIGAWDVTRPVDVNEDVEAALSDFGHTSVADDQLYALIDVAIVSAGLPPRTGNGIKLFRENFLDLCVVTVGVCNSAHAANGL
ncbi:hypothetical protein [uncultured Sulfitobacter sp.]|uniref:hypothetical protein n=1 Tax=uncultured Sulfitobacter sp. TaxID=191468 RepID=UPI0026300C4C|nr:hypothetical protein [uncultured Sulfitobacter sp.]